MSIQMTKVWFDGEKIVSQEIPEEKLYWQSITQEDIDKALAQPEQDPVAFINVEKQNRWVGLTDEEIWNVLHFRGYNTDTIEIAKAIEAKLKEKNNAN